jgi:hypothetical protein
MKATIRIGEKSRAAVIRDEEARTVADICAQLIGNVRVRRSGGETSLIVPGDIALLAPIGTELWRYERALEERGPPLVQLSKDILRDLRILILGSLCASFLPSSLRCYRSGWSGMLRLLLAGSSRCRHRAAKFWLRASRAALSGRIRL